MRRTEKMATIITVVLVSALACALLASCSDNTPRERGDRTSKLDLGNCNCVVIYAHRQNSNGSLQTLEDCVHATAESWGYFDVIRADGNPQSCMPGGNGVVLEPDEGINNLKLQTQNVEEKCEELLQNLKEENACDAKAPEVDLYQALKRANASFANSRVPDDLENVVVIIDSGISTKGYVDFTQISLLNFNPQKYVSSLVDQGKVGPDDLNNIDRVEWRSFNAASNPQEEVYSAKMRDDIEQFYKSLLTGAGIPQGNVNIVEDSSAGDDIVSSADLPPVTVIDINRAEAIVSDKDITFIENSDEFAEPDVAREKLNHYAEILASSDITLKITGYTDTRPYGGEGGNQRLSELRAERVKQCLVDNGATAQNITTVGGGESTEYPTDAENRRVELDFAAVKTGN